MSYGFKVSQANFDVGTSNDINLVLSTKYNIFKTSVQGQTNLVVASGSSQSPTTSISHGLGYAPMFYVYAVATDGQNFLTNTTAYTPGTQTISINRNIYSWSDGTNVNFFVHFGTAGTYNAYYYIFYDPI